MTQVNGIEYRNMLDGNVYFVADVLTRDRTMDELAFMNQNVGEEPKSPGEIKKVEYLQGYKVLPLIFSFCPYCGTRLSMPDWEPDLIIIEKEDAKDIIEHMRGNINLSKRMRSIKSKLIKSIKEVEARREQVDVANFEGNPKKKNRKGARLRK